MKNRNGLLDIMNVFFTKEFLTFLVIGGINTLNGMMFPTIFMCWLQANVAYVVSYIPSLLISYILNSIFTFKEKKLSLKKCIKFYISYIPNFIIQNIVFFVCYNIFDLNKYVGIILSAVIGVPVTFLIMKFFAFKK